MEGANAFKEEVLAYPAITLILNKQNQSKVKYADIKDISTLDTIECRILSAPTDDDWSKMFNTDNQELKLIEEQGFKIGIGVATGADKIFIDDPAVRLFHIKTDLRILFMKILHERGKIIMSGNR